MGKLRGPGRHIFAHKWHRQQAPARGGARVYGGQIGWGEDPKRHPVDFGQNMGEKGAEPVCGKVEQTDAVWGYGGFHRGPEGLGLQGVEWTCFRVMTELYS